MPSEELIFDVSNRPNDAKDPVMITIKRPISFGDGCSRSRGGDQNRKPSCLHPICINELIRVAQARCCHDSNKSPALSSLLMVTRRYGALLGRNAAYMRSPRVRISFFRETTLAEAESNLSISKLAL